MADDLIAPLEVFAIDAKMNRCTGSIPYRSLIWRRRYHECGDFEMVVPANVFDQSWQFIECDDRPETGIIQKVEFNDDSQVYGGIDSITVSGFFLESILNNVVFLQESPEQEKVYIPKPRQTVYRPSMNPKVYTDTVGGYYFENSQGQIQDASDPTHVFDSAEGLTELNYTLPPGIGFSTDAVKCWYSYYTDSSHSTVTTVGWGVDDGETHEIAFEDDKGNAYFWDQNGPTRTLRQANSVVEGEGGTYHAKLKSWLALPDDDPYGRYVMKTVKGPWQRTEMMEPVTEGDSIDIVMKWARSMMGDWIKWVEPDIEGVQKAVDPSFQHLGDLVYATLKEVGASFRLEYDFPSNIFAFSVYRGTDRTQSQTSMPWAVFSDTWGTLTGYSASRDTSNYKNTCYVLYDYERPNSFRSDGWPQSGTISAVDDVLYPSLYGIQYTKMRGYNTETVGDEDEPSIETYLDIRDKKPSCDGDWSREVTQLDTSSTEAWQASVEEAAAKYAPPSDGNVDLKSIYDAYESSIPGIGEAHLKENYSTITNLDTGVINTGDYLRTFDLGDLVELSISTVGLQDTGRIIGVDETYDENGASIEIEIGDRKMTTIKKARLP